MSSSLQEQLQRALGGSYLLERELGGGGMSRVFVALEHSLGRKVVVKVLLPDLAAAVNVERFRREIQLAAKLQHPHIVPLLSAGEAEGLPYLIMPYVSGESLRARVAREGEFPIAETVRILRDIVSALAYAHSNGVIHRDVKPDNVLISGGVAVVTDFGVAKAVTASSDSGASGLTSLGVALGTPAYMAPEQATASPNTDHRADIYALGIVAYEMLTGSPPFTGRSTQQVLAAQVIEEPEPVERRRPAVPPTLATLVRECLAKRPADRPQTATQVMHALDAIATPSGGTAATTAVRVPAARLPEAGRKRPLLASAAALLLLLGGGALWLRQNEPVPVAPAAPPPPASSQTARIPPQPEAQPDPPEPPAARVPAAAADTPAWRKARAEQRKARAEQRRIPPTQPAAVAAESLVTDSAPSGALAAASPPMAVVESAPAPPPAPAAVPAPAPLPRPADAAPEIRNVVAAYAGAIESRSLVELQRVYPGMTPMQQRGWEQFFQLVRDVRAQLVVLRLDVAGSAAEAQVAGSYTYLNTSTGKAETLPVTFHASFRREGERWRMREVK